MILTTTPTIEGKRITEYHGIVTGEAIMGANIIKDFLAGVRDIVGGRSASYEKELHRAREIALKELEVEAVRVGANAVVGLEVTLDPFAKAADTEATGLRLHAVGTAAKLEPLF